MYIYMSKCNAIYIAQTDVKTVPPITSIKNDNIATDELLYGIVGILLICLCCLGCFCLYFIYHTQSQYIKTPNSSNSAISNSNNSKTPSTNATNAFPSNTANKAPAQHQIIQMNEMCNQSAPPSLSEFIKNTNYPVNTNPIPPSNEQSFDTITNPNTMLRCMLFCY